MLGMTRTTWCFVGLGGLVLLTAWGLRDDAILWQGRWRYRTPRAIRATPAVADGLVCFGGEDGWMRALEAHTLGRHWTYAWRWVHTTLFVWGLSGPPAPLPGLRWQHRVNGPIVASAAVAQDLVYVASQRGTLTALELRSGTARWSFAAHQAIVAAPVVAGDVLSSKRILAGVKRRPILSTRSTWQSASSVPHCQDVSGPLDISERGPGHVVTDARFAVSI
jgi:hypothetical protein